MRPTRRSSTARRPRPIALPGAEKVGLGAGDRSLARRANDEIHADCLGRLIAFEITPGQLGDVRTAGALLAPMPAARLCIADTAYDSNGLRQFLSERGTQPVIPNNPTRKRFHPFDADIYKRRNLIERMFCRLKDWRRIATRYDKLAANFAAAVAIATIVLWWT
jgi:transposase